MSFLNCFINYFGFFLELWKDVFWFVKINLNQYANTLVSTNCSGKYALYFNFSLNFKYFWKQKCFSLSKCNMWIHFNFDMFDQNEIQMLPVLLFAVLVLCYIKANTMKSRLNQLMNFRKFSKWRWKCTRHTKKQYYIQYINIYIYTYMYIYF